MALQNRILNQPVVTNNLIKKWTVGLEDLQGLGAFTSGDVILFDAPKGTVIQYVKVKPVTILAGPSLSAATARVITAAHNYGTAFNVFQAPGATVFDFDDEGQAETHAAVVPVLLHVTETGLTGGLFSTLTTGEIDVFISYFVMA